MQGPKANRARDILPQKTALTTSAPIFKSAAIKAYSSP